MSASHPAAEPMGDVLHVEPCGDDRFTISLRGFDGTSFGGQYLGCAARAAGLTCEGRTMHSLHATFLRPVPPDTPVDVRVERISDGRRLARRRVSLHHDGKLRCEVVASFTAPGSGLAFQDEHLPSGIPAPEELPDQVEVAEREGWGREWRDPFDWAWVGAPYRQEPDAPPHYHAWVRPAHALPEDPALVAGTYAYLSDLHVHWPVQRKFGGQGIALPFAFLSLDQSLWVHQDAAWDDWWLLTSACDIAHDGRALTHRTLHARDGRLIVTMAQETLLPSKPD